MFKEGSEIVKSKGKLFYLLIDVKDGINMLGTRSNKEAKPFLKGPNQIGFCYMFDSN
jgi:hypothetical protein